MYKIGRVLLSVFLVSLIALACEGPSGPEGIQGSEGPEGPIGPAGEDGSMMYAGEGEPSDDIGDIGDYYLNQDTGEMHGPKDEDGWGNPIIVLMGEDGQDGADGENGTDGEDGSQIYSGEGVPDSELGVAGDYYLDKDNYELYGPKTSNGWGSPLNLKGADGNANVTRYIYSGHDFAQIQGKTMQIPNIDSEEQMNENGWLVYLIDSDPNVSSVHIPIPGYGWRMDTHYAVFIGWDHSSFYFSEPSVICAIDVDGPGEEYEGIEIVRIEASNTQDMTKQKGSIIPDHLDVSDYKAVAEYYGFYK